MRAFKILGVAFSVAAVLALAITTADARGRKGSHRVGGGSHGKGSHYVGGR